MRIYIIILRLCRSWRARTCQKDQDLTNCISAVQDQLKWRTFIRNPRIIYLNIHMILIDIVNIHSSGTVKKENVCPKGQDS